MTTNVLTWVSFLSHTQQSLDAASFPSVTYPDSKPDDTRVGDQEGYTLIETQKTIEKGEVMFETVNLQSRNLIIEKSPRIPA